MLTASTASGIAHHRNAGRPSAKGSVTSSMTGGYIESPIATV
jgi:hypothetical protein